MPPSDPDREFRINWSIIYPSIATMSSCLFFFFFGFSNGGFIAEEEKRGRLAEWVENVSFDRIY